MKKFKWLDILSGDIFEKELQVEFFRDAEKDEDFMKWSFARIIKRLEA